MRAVFHLEGENNNVTMENVTAEQRDAIVKALDHAPYRFIHIAPGQSGGDHISIPINRILLVVFHP
jgi:hypothetical protein